MSYRILLQPSEPRIWSIRFEDEREPFLCQCLTFQEAIIAWWSGFDDAIAAELVDVPIDIGASLADGLSVWIKLPSEFGGGDWEWFLITVTDITEEYHGVQSGNLVGCEGLREMRRPRKVRDKEQAAKDKQAEMIAQLKALQAKLLAESGE